MTLLFLLSLGQVWLTYFQNCFKSECHFKKFQDLIISKNTFSYIEILLRSEVGTELRMHFKSQSHLICNCSHLRSKYGSHVRGCVFSNLIQIYLKIHIYHPVYEKIKRPRDLQSTWVPTFVYKIARARAKTDSPISDHFCGVINFSYTYMPFYTQFSIVTLYVSFVYPI